MRSRPPTWPSMRLRREATALSVVSFMVDTIPPLGICVKRGRKRAPRSAGPPDGIEERGMSDPKAAHGHHHHHQGHPGAHHHGHGHGAAADATMAERVKVQPPRQRAAPAEPVADGPRRSAGGRPSTRRVPVVNPAARARRPRASQVRHAMPVTLPERLRRPRRSPVGLCYRCRADAVRSRRQGEIDLRPTHWLPSGESRWSRGAGRRGGRRPRAVRWMAGPRARPSCWRRPVPPATGDAPSCAHRRGESRASEQAPLSRPM
jgi:hypothetical protein